jgi:hypothetical protein
VRRGKGEELAGEEVRILSYCYITVEPILQPDFINSYRYDVAFK